MEIKLKHLSLASLLDEISKAKKILNSIPENQYWKDRLYKAELELNRRCG